MKREKFIQCPYLLLEIPTEEIDQFEEIESIDEVVEFLNKSLEPRPNLIGRLQRIDKIPPEVEFWGHYLNLQ